MVAMTKPVPVFIMHLLLTLRAKCSHILYLWLKYCSREKGFAEIHQFSFCNCLSLDLFLFIWCLARTLKWRTSQKLSLLSVFFFLASSNTVAVRTYLALMTSQEIKSALAQLRFPFSTWEEREYFWHYKEWEKCCFFLRWLSDPLNMCTLRQIHFDLSCIQIFLISSSDDISSYLRYGPGFSIRNADCQTMTLQKKPASSIKLSPLYQLLLIWIF